jgi:hypothetical protein
MRRALGWLTGVVGVAALAKLLRRQRQPASAPPPSADPAAELRETLARSREAEPAAPPESAEPAEPTAETPPTSPEERRSQVHDRAHETIGRIRDSSGEDQ